MGRIGMITSAVAMLLLAVGCTHTQQATFRPQGAQREWKVTVEYSDFTNNVIVHIDGTEALRTRVPMFGTTRNAAAQYQGHEIDVMVIKARTGEIGGIAQSTVHCTVSIDKQIVGRWAWGD